VCSYQLLVISYWKMTPTEDFISDCFKSLNKNSLKIIYNLLHQPLVYHLVNEMFVVVFYKRNNDTI
jgi:hypothetical protein